MTRHSLPRFGPVFTTVAVTLIVVFLANPGWTQGPGNGKAGPAAADPDKTIVAYVNGVPITRQELAEELIARRGKKQLELLINRKIIEQAAQKAGITVSDAEVEAELKEFMAAAGCVTARDFERNVLQKRDTTLFEYKEDVIKPAILMRKLGGQRVAVTDDDLRKAFESKYGERVQCRVILEKNKRQADAIYHEILAAAGSGEADAIPAAFLRKARTQADPTLAANAGLIHISRHSAWPNMEQRAFQLRDGEMSEVLQTPEGYVILLREKLLPPMPGKKFEDEKENLRKEYAETKLRTEVPKLFKELREQAVVQDFLNNKYDIITIMEQLGSLPPAGTQPRKLP
ncbi:MAG: SurA N-terminal domain-containing protein [Gemmatales bacterium]|nr:SurA N-terminal domain-containing protein [Gemmatales bacterium]MDW8386182.1 SurA N-terminal domain-containing protein [Gemmatales bacterium]